MTVTGDSADLDPQETREWLDALESVLEERGQDRANFLLQRLAARMSQTGAQLPYAITTPYRNTIPPEREATMPGDLFMERRIRSFIRWNALAMVMRANLGSDELGGHISSFSSSATLYEVGFNYFFRAPTAEHRGDLVYIQGHSAPGIYARSYLEGRLDEKHLDNFRREVSGEGLSSYPHPWLMPDYWQFPTVSMGLGSIQAIYQARVMKYADSRGLAPMGDRKIWCFLGDGECDEPESLGAISLAGRERLDNLIFVINCNLQRLDGPVRGNGQIIQELEGIFRGAGWNVLKVVWGRLWDPLFRRDRNGLMQELMDRTVDGEYQNFRAHGGAYTREHFFNKHPEIAKLAEGLSDDDIMRLNRGGHDPYKLYAAYHEAVNHRGQPTVVLAKTVKGYGLGDAVEAENTTHSAKKLGMDSLKSFRDRFAIPLTDGQLEELPYYRPDPDAPEIIYLRRRREALGGFLPQRQTTAAPLPTPDLDFFQAVLKGSGERQISTTMVFVRLLSTLIRDRVCGPRVVPIVPDEARTFGMEGMFKQLGIYSPVGQLYESVDSGTMTAYRESEKGQVLEEGITEAGAFCAWMAAATSYANHGQTLIPFYIFYSMFGFQRVGDLAWAAGDVQARGFLLGATSGRTTLNGEGLQHQDGHSHVLASILPNCIAYDPTYGYELAVIIHNGLKRMCQNQENLFFYITLMNENYVQPALPEGEEVVAGIVRGIYCLERDFDGDREDSPKCVHLLGCGAILREARQAAKMLRENHGCKVNVWSVTSFNELRRDGLDTVRWNMLHPDQKPRTPYLRSVLGARPIPCVAVSDYVKSYVDQVRQFVPGSLHSLGTDGFGRSDSRKNLRAFFEIDARFVSLAVLHALMEMQAVAASEAAQALIDWGVDAEKCNPRLA